MTDARQCAACGAAIAYGGTGRPRRYCLQCTPPGPGNRQAWRSINAEREAAYEAQRRRPLEERACIDCGQVFVTGRQARIYCSRPCGSRHRQRLYRERLLAAQREAWRPQREWARKQEAAWRRRTERLLDRKHGRQSTTKPKVNRR